MAADLDTIRDFLFVNMWRHFKVNRMTSKAKRVVTDLFDLFMSETNTLPTSWQASGGIPIIELDEAARAEVIALVIDKDLGLVLQLAKRRGMQDAVSVPLIGRAADKLARFIGALGFGMDPPA